ncbi:MAG TPA: methyl-accepting chemotaxis protein [Petrotogaceae bacterium]|nr:methyl-accepting chemotaxis protein [Petrotogaceae bacterium]HQI79174.1 methyl-accepting chemotaxis protein [Petrotogaceae bacterium]
MKKSIGGLIILLILLVSALPLGVLTAYTSVNSYSKDFKSVSEYLLLDNLQKSSAFESFITPLMKTTDFITTDSELISSLEDKSKREVVVGIFADLQKKFPEIQLAYAGYPDKALVSYPVVDLGKDFDPTVRVWYTQAKASPRNVILTDPYIDAVTKLMMVSITKAVVDPSSNNVVAVFGVDFSLDALKGILFKESSYKTAYSFVANEAGVIVIHKDNSLVGKSVKDQEFFVKASSGSGYINYTSDKKKYLAFYEKLPSTKWIVYTVIEEAEVLSEAKSSLIIMLILSGSIIAAAIVIALVFVKTLIAKPIAAIVKDISAFGKGDLTIRFSEKGGSEIEEMAKSLNSMAGSLSESMKSIQEASQQINSSAGDLASVSEETSATSEELSSQAESIQNNVQNTSASIEELSSSVDEVATSAQNVSKASLELAKSAQQVSETVNNGLKDIKGISDIIKEAVVQTDNTASLVTALATQSVNVGKIVDSINSITEQTNLLALNAAIEAARAGEAGKGFAVVADEIRKLAEESKKATQNITTILTDVQQKASQADLATKQTKSIVEKVNTGGNNISVQFTEIAKQVDNITSMTENVSASAQQQSAAAQEITSAMENASKMTTSIYEEIKNVVIAINQQSEAAQQVSANGEELNALAEGLESQVKKFKV